MQESSAGGVRDLAWAGRHAEAIEQANWRLDAPRLDAATRLDLLEARGDSRVALGDLEAAAADAAAMLALAKSSGKAAFASRARSFECLV